MNDIKTIYYEPDMQLAGFAMIPNSVLFDLRLSPEAKTIYAILFSRTQLSACIENIEKFTDKYGRIFVYYPLKDMMRTLGTGRYTVEKAFDELKSAGLLETVRQGLGKANRLYIKIPAINIAEDDELNYSSDAFAVANSKLDLDLISEPDDLHKSSAIT